MRILAQNLLTKIENSIQLLTLKINGNNRGGTMINHQTDTAKTNLHTLCVALLNHTLLLKSGLTPYEAECATFTTEVEQALDESTPQVQENFGLYMQYQVEQIQKDNLVPTAVVANKVISMSNHLAKRNQQQALALVDPAAHYNNSDGQLRSNYN